MRAVFRPGLAWFRLNIDGALLAFLCMLAGTEVFNPARESLPQTLGYVPPTFYLWTTGYLIAGVLLMVSFVCRHIGTELAGRLILCLALTLESVRTAMLTGWGTAEMWEDVAVWLVVVGVCGTRTSVLLSKKGVAVVIPPREPEETS